MRRYYNICIYFFENHIRTNIFAFQAAIWLIFLWLRFSADSTAFVSGCTDSCILLFFLAGWLGFSFMEKVSDTEEQVLLLKAQNRKAYYWSKCMAVYAICAAFAVMGILIPLIQYAIKGSALFHPAVLPIDFVAAFILFTIIAVLGSTVGMFFQPRVFQERKLAGLALFLFLLLGLVKHHLAESVPSLKWILWVFPPFADILLLFSRNAHLGFHGFGLSIVYTGLYGVTAWFISLILLERNLF